MLSDFNCQILNIEKRNNFVSDSLYSDFEQEKRFLCDIERLGSLGFHRLIYQVPYDPDRDILSHLNKKIKTVEQSLRKITSRRLSAKFIMRAVLVTYLTDETPYLKNIEKTIVPESNYIFLELPWGHFPDKTAVTINKLLYSNKLLPIFANFHLYSALYDADAVQRLISIKGAGYQFAMKLSVLSENFNIIKHIIKNDGIVLLGSSCDHDNLNISEISKCLEMLQRRLSAKEYAALVLRARVLIK